ncbi:uncharacterized protein BP01DRAFT_359795 [Aspergillus saccharolyticus JOP 1030-1]|uniref:Uncharacterized protein n=1 Tax=Aspergillus saccharolyticus JOP 1030-1 TaxID=1450539 RepID=A0A319A3G9_9EURO|nr:hypothetical protein BP01DRAFT_359795 [Aspergillus saccharolyticus JOP 1030-1]PYH42002.1 hypothetical protein BP01DRAFT_359795 [Aspergillus saccharolyticus JOP 1030-1]
MHPINHFPTLHSRPPFRIRPPQPLPQAHRTHHIPHAPPSQQIYTRTIHRGHNRPINHLANHHQSHHNHTIHPRTQQTHRPDRYSIHPETPSHSRSACMTSWDLRTGAPFSNATMRLKTAQNEARRLGRVLCL